MANFNPRSVEEIFLQFKSRRTALLTALTTDYDELYRQCDPAQKVKLCLYGHPGEQWEVNGAARHMHPVLPEPLRGINFVRDRMRRSEWVAMIALHSDIWLLAVAFSFSSKFGHDKADRSRLFDMINELPTILEVVSRKAREPPKHEPKLLNDDDTNKPKRKWPTVVPARSGEEEGGEVVCGECDEGYIEGDVLKQCFVCKSSFHLMKCHNYPKDLNPPLFECASCALKPFTESDEEASTS